MGEGSMIRPPPSPRVVQYTRTLTVRIIHCLFLLIYIVPEKPLWGGNNEVCMCVYYVIHVTIRTDRMD